MCSCFVPFCVFFHTQQGRARRKEFFCLRLIHPKSKGKEECGPEILFSSLVKINIFRISQKGDEKKEKIKGETNEEDLASVQ